MKQIQLFLRWYQDPQYHKTYAVNEVKSINEKKEKQTTIDISLPMPVPVGYLKIYVGNKFNYYRPVSINYMTDSFATEKGWMYNCASLTSGTLNSIEKKEFKFNGKILKTLRIVIENSDNQPLKIDSVKVRGFEYSLLARSTEPAAYYLVYGNDKVSKPDYDIGRFADKIPATVIPLSLSKEDLVKKEKVLPAGPLFQNKIGLWTVMIIIILGWFSVKMMRKAE